jgi:hypothetical protein
MVASECVCEVYRGPRCFAPPFTASFHGGKEAWQAQYARERLHSPHVNFTRPVSRAVFGGHAVQRAPRNGRIQFLSL